jgi:tetratricopeptide (TPR) repeat protein
MTRSTAAPFVVLLALAACRNTETQREQKVVLAAREGRFEEAIEHARELAEQNPLDPALQALYLDTRVAAILARGRRQVFAEELDEALRSFETAAELAPGHPTVLAWIEKTQKQLATYWLDRAAENTGPEKLDQAEAAYEIVLEHDPKNPYAVEGLAHVLLLKNYRAGQSKTYFDDGLASFRELRLQNAWRSFEVSQRYRKNDPALMRGEEVEDLIIEERLAQAHALEADGHFFAARNEYRLVLLIDPAHADGRAGFDRMDRETRATAALDEADMEIRRGELEEARETLATAEVLTEAQRDELSLMNSGIEEKRLDDLYQEALRLTEDYRYPEAVAAYEVLLAAAPDHKDAAQNKRTIEEFILLAEEFYAKAAAAKSDEEKELQLRQVLVIWPEFKDAAAQLAEILKRKPAEKETPDADAPAAPR